MKTDAHLVGSERDVVAQQSEWTKRWDAGRIGFHQLEVNAQLVQYWPELVPDVSASVVVPLCGKSHDMRWLHARGHKVVGVELVEQACHAFFQEHGLDYEAVDARGHVRFCGRGTAEGITVLCGDAFSLTPDDIGPIDAWYDRAAVVALPPSFRAPYADWVAGLMRPGAVGFMLTFDYPQAEMMGPPYSVGVADVQGHFGTHFDMQLHETLDLTEGNRWTLSRVQKHVLSLNRR